MFSSGNARADCGNLLDNMNQDRFTIIAMDPQGYGYSRPPERVYDKDTFYELDANVLTAAMKVRLDAYYHLFCTNLMYRYALKASS